MIESLLCKSSNAGLSPAITSPNIVKKMCVRQYKNPYTYQYVAPFGYHFVRSGINYGRIAWFSNVDGVTIEKDEDK